MRLWAAMSPYEVVSYDNRGLVAAVSVLLNE